MLSATSVTSASVASGITGPTVGGIVGSVTLPGVGP